MGQNRTKPDNSGGLVNRSGLHRSDLMLAQSLAHDVEPARQRGITERSLCRANLVRADRADQRLFGIDELGLSLGQCRSDCASRFTTALHGYSLIREDQS